MADAQPQGQPGGFWNGLARVLAQVAIWAAEHPQVVQAVVDAAAHADKD